MGATLDALHALQEVEIQIAEIRQRIERRHRAVRRQEAAIAQHDESIRRTESAFMVEQMDADRLNLDVKSREAEMAKMRVALNQTKTNKEYSAILTQINTVKADSLKVEDLTLAAMTKVESRRTELAELRAAREAEAAKLTELKQAAAEIEAKSKKPLDSLEAERARAAEPVPPAVLDSFNRIAAKHDGEAMALIIRTNPKRAEYACEGCNMSITIEQVNNVMSRDEAILCNSCGRILYLETSAASR